MLKMFSAPQKGRNKYVQLVFEVIKHLLKKDTVEMEPIQI